MKKSLIAFASICMLFASVARAGHIHENTDPVQTVAIEKTDLNSFCKAIIKGDLETVKKLIELGEDINRKSLGMTPAIYAARYNKADILELLIRNGADLSIKSDKGITVEKYAKSANAVDAIAVLQATKGI